MYVIGKTGTGKTNLLSTLIQQDLENGEGIAVFDPHADLIDKAMAAVPEERKNDLIYIDVGNYSHSFAFNPLENVPVKRRPLAASGLLEVFKKLWSDSWGPRLEHILRNSLLTLLDQPQTTLADILRLLHDQSFRKHAAERAQNSHVRDFWFHEFDRYPANFRAEAIAPIENKVGAFLANPYLSKILSQPKSSFNLRTIMDEGKILLVNLAKGKIGTDTATLLGSLFVTSVGLAGFSRSDTSEINRHDFYVYLDEFHTFSTLSLTTMLSELRKYRIGMILAHQYLGQVDEQIRDAVLGNVGTMISFRLGTVDAEILGKEFCPEFSNNDLMSLDNYQIYLKLMIDGKISNPFSAETFKSTMKVTQSNRLLN